MLGTVGITESQARGHSIAWVREVIDACTTREREQRAVTTFDVFMASAAAFNGDKAFAVLRDHVQELARNPRLTVGPEPDLAFYAQLEAEGYVELVKVTGGG